MSISDLDDKQVFSGNGSTTDFTIPFTIVDSATDEVEVYLVDITAPLLPVPALKVISTHYTLTGGTSDANRTTVHFLAAPATTDKVVVRRKFSLIQDLTLSSSGPYPATEHENSLDRIVAMIQMLNERIRRGVQFEVHSSLTNVGVPEFVADCIWAWDPVENKVVNGPTTEALFDAEANAVAAAASASSSASQSSTSASQASSSATAAGVSAAAASVSAANAAVSAAGAVVSAAAAAASAVTAAAAALASLNIVSRSGQVAISNAADHIDVVFSSALSAATYGLDFSFMNLTDTEVIFMRGLVTARSTTGFTVTFEQAIDTANYVLAYNARLAV